MHEIRDERILVMASGFMRGTDVYHPKDLGETVVESKSSEKTGPIEPISPVGLTFGDGLKVERRSAWSVLQFFCGVICIIAGCVFLSDNEEITGIAFIAIGVQAFFIGFLINVFTDIRWFLQEINQKMPPLDKPEAEN